MCDHALASASIQDYGQPYGGNLHPDMEIRLKIAIKEAEDYQERELTEAEQANIRFNILRS